MILNKEIIFQNEIKTNEFNLVRVVDETINRQVYCILNYNGIDKYVLLWEGTEYDAIGQWTDVDVINRLNEIF